MKPKLCFNGHALLTVLILSLAAVSGSSFAQVNFQRVAGYEYAQWNGQWFTVTNGQQGDLVNVGRLVVRLRDRGEIEEFDFARVGLPQLKVVTPRFIEDLILRPHFICYFSMRQRNTHRESKINAIFLVIT